MPIWNPVSEQQPWPQTFEPLKSIFKAKVYGIASDIPFQYTKTVESGLGMLLGQNFPRQPALSGIHICTQEPFTEMLQIFGKILTATIAGCITLSETKLLFCLPKGSRVFMVNGLGLCGNSVSLLFGLIWSLNSRTPSQCWDRVRFLF